MVHLFAASTYPTLAMLLIASVWQGAALVLIAAAAVRLLPGLSPAGRSAVWATVLALAALLPLALLSPLHGSSAGSAHQPLWHAPAVMGFALVMLWGLASLFRLAQLILSAVHLRGLLRHAQVLPATPETSALLVVGSQQIALCASPDIDRPSVAGFFRPRIILPLGLSTSLNEADLRHILLHEREHIRRGDHWINLLGQLSLVFFPLNPALVWLNRRLALEREFACDDSVLRSTAAPKAYAACLARVAEGSLLHRGLSLAIGILGRGAHRPELARRVERILHASARPSGSPRTRLASGALCATLLGVCTVFAHTPQFISFAPALPQILEVSTGMSFNAFPVSARSNVFGSARPVLMKAVMPADVHTPRWASPRHASFRKPVNHRNSGPRVVVARYDAERSPNRNPNRQPSRFNLVPVLLRVTSGNFVGEQTWYTAVHTPDGWIVVQI